MNQFPFLLYFEFPLFRQVRVRRFAALFPSFRILKLDAATH
jgi:hypothetical protein